MIPVAFKESNFILNKPPGMTDEQCDPFAAYTQVLPDGSRVIISCWKLTAEELEEFNKTKKIWLWVYGEVHPPVNLSAFFPFKPE